MVERTARFEGYWPVDIDRLRPDGSYERMIEVRKRRMQFYVGHDGAIRDELVEPVSCPVCGGGDFDEQFRKEGFTFVRCRSCALIYVNPCLKEENVKQVYEHQSYSDIANSLLSPSAAYRRERFGTERVQIINRFVRSGRKRGLRLLDVGCATGFFLEAAREDGWEVYGVEPNPYLADFARKSGLNVRNETIEETTFSVGYFNAITLFEVIEHVRRPVQILKKVYSLLQPGGVVFVYTPNFDCAERLILGTEAHFIWGSNHLNYFTAGTLQKALEKAGFVVEHCETQGLDVEDMLSYFQQKGSYDLAFVQDFKHELQFLFNAGGWGKNMRMYARKQNCQT